MTEKRVNKAYTKQWDKDKYFTEDQIKNDRIVNNIFTVALSYFYIKMKIDIIFYLM